MFRKYNLCNKGWVSYSGLCFSAFGHISSFSDHPARGLLTLAFLGSISGRVILVSHEHLSMIDKYTWNEYLDNPPVAK